MNWKKTIKKIARGIAYLSLSAVLIAVIILGAGQTGQGKEYLVRILQRVFAEEGVRIGKLTGFIPFHFQVDHVALADPQGDWLVLRGIRVRWSPLHLLKGNLRFALLSADTMDLPRRSGRTAVGTMEWKIWGPWPYLLQRLRVEEFSIGRLNLGETLLGRQASFSVKATTRASSQAGFLETRIKAEQHEGGEARFTAEATWSLLREALSVNARFEEPAGGVLAGTLALEGPLFFSLDGEGAVKDWKGSLKGGTGSLGTVDSEIHLLRGKDTEVTFTGSFKINRRHLPESVAAFLSDEASLTFTARPESTERVSLKRLSFKTAKISLELGGLLDLAWKSSRIDFSLVSQDLSPLRLYLKSGPSGVLTARGTLSGSPWRPKAVLDVRLENPALGGVRAGKLESRWDVGPPEAGGSFPSRFHVKGDGRIGDLTTAEAAVTFPKWIAWSGEAEFSPGNPVRVRRLLVDSEKISAVLTGEVDALRARGHIDLSLELEDSTPLSDFLGFQLPLLAGTSLRGNLRGDLKEQVLAGTIHGETRIHGEEIPAIDPIVSKGVKYSLTFSVNGNKEIVLSGAEIKTAGASLQGDLSLDLSLKRLKSNWDLRLPDLAPLSATLGWPLEGSLSLRGSTEGPFRSATTRAEFRGDDLRVNGVAINESSAQINMVGLPPHSSGGFSLNISHEQDLFLSEARFDLDGGRLHVPYLSFEGAGIIVKGKVDTHPARRSIEGELKCSSHDLSTFSSLLGKNLFGSAEIDSKFRLGDESRKLVVDARGMDLRGFGGNVQTAELHAQLTGDHKAPSGTTRLSLTGLRLGDLGLSNLEMTALSDGNRIAYSARAEGRYRQAFEIMTSGEVLPFSETQEATIRRLQGSFAGTPIALIQPATLVRSREGVALENILFSLGGGRFEGGASFETGEIKVNSRFEKLPLNLATIFRPSTLQGVASGDMVLQGPPHELEGRIEVRVDRFALQQHLPAELPPASLELTAVLEKHLLRSHFSVSGLTEEPLRASLELPLNLSVGPLALSVPPSAPLRGMLNGSMNLVRLTSFFALPDQSIRGEAKIVLSLEGTPAEPSISGRIDATKGGYENYRTGTIIKDAEIEIEASNRDLRIKHAEGKDAEGGIVTAEGWMSLDSSNAFPFRVDFTVQHARVARLDEAAATVDGSGTLEGSLEKATVKGRFTVESSEFQIPKRLPARLAEVEVIEIHGKGSEAEYQPVAKKQAGKGGSLFLDLSLRIPGRALLRGRGLESEWQGDLAVRGEAGRPELKGSLSLIRGRFELLSKRFDLTRGVITFSGDTPPRPLLDVTGEARAKDLLARLQVSGFIQSLEIKLTSEPPYPPDEILAHLLFGRKLHQITPLQAVQLADALNTLRGSEGFDLMGRTQRLLGVDELTIGETTVGETKEAEEKPSLKIGKYVSENVYLHVESGVSSETGKASVEWQVTPHVTVETDVGVNASAGVGINWRWDY